MLLLFADVISLPLALQDYMPVILFGLGLFFIARMIAKENPAAGNLAYLGFLLIPLAGVFKASWKLIQALGGPDVPFFNHSLFVLLSAGFICIAWALWKSRSAEMTSISLWGLPILLIAVLWGVAGYFGFMRESRAWFFILLGAATLGNLFLGLQLIFRSYKIGLWISVLFFAINLIVVFMLARGADQTVTLQWIKQIGNTISNGAFLAASYFLFKKTNELK